MMNVKSLEAIYFKYAVKKMLVIEQKKNYFDVIRTQDK